MKIIHHLSLVALFGSFAVAVPANILSLTLSLKEEDAVTHEREVNPLSHDPCLKVCWQQQEQCALRSYALHLGGCWTCCGCSAAPKPGDTAEFPALAVQTEAGDLKESPALVTQRNKDVVEKDICLRICYPHPPKCQEKWYGTGGPGCYTCCKCTSAPGKDTHASCTDKASFPATHKENKLGL